MDLIKIIITTRQVTTFLSQYDHFIFFCLDWFLLIEGRHGEPDMNTALEFSNTTLTSDTCFLFWFHMSQDSIKKLSILIEHEDGHQDVIWYYESILDYWFFGQTLVNKASNFKVCGS